MRIRTKGLKARDLDLDIPKLVVLAGPNGSSKSTVTDGIRFAVLDHVPALGKKPDRTAAIMRGREMTVDVALDDGRTWSRTLTDTGKGLTGSVECGWLDRAKESEVNAAIIRLLGKDSDEVAEGLDLRKLIHAPDNQRAARIMQFLEAGAPDPVSLAKRVAHYAVQRLAKIDDHRMPTDYRDALPMVPPAQEAFLRSLAPMLLDKIGKVKIEGTVTWANDEKNAIHKTLLPSKHARREHEARLAELPEVDETELETLEAQRADLDESIGAARERFSGIESRRSQFDAARKRLAETEDTLAICRQARADFEEATAGNSGARLLEIDAQLAQITAPAPADYSAADEIENAIVGKRAELAGKRAAAERIVVPDTDSAEREVGRLGAAIEEAEANPWAKARDLIDAVLKEASAAKMAAPSRVKITAPATELRAMAEGFLAVDVEALRRDMKRATAKLQELQGLAAVARTEADAIAAAAEDLRLQIAEMEERASNIRRSARTAHAGDTAVYAEARRDLETEADGIRAARTKHSERDGQTRRALDRAEKDYAVARESLDRIEAEHGERPIDETQDTRPALESKRAELRKRIDELRGTKATRDEIERLIGQIDEAEAQHRVWVELENGLRRVGAEEVTAQGGPLRERMSTFLRAAGIEAAPFFRAEKDRCEIGWVAPEGEVLLQALAQGEWVTYVAGLTATVLDLRGAELRMLLVEAGECDHQTLLGLMRGISAVADSLTQVVVCSWHAPIEAVDGWVVMTPEGERLAEAA